VEYSVAVKLPRQIAGPMALLMDVPASSVTGVNITPEGTKMTNHRTPSSLHYRIAAAIVCMLGISAAAVGKTIEIPFDETDFTDPPRAISNPYLPLDAGPPTRWFVAVADDECEISKQTMGYAAAPADGFGNYTVPAGVATRVLRDQEWVTEAVDGECVLGTAELAEDTLDFHAQDGDGGVWYLGEQTWSRPDEDEGDQCSDSGAWEADGGDILPGVVMLADPEPGDRYRQEFFEDEAEDWGAVLRLNGGVTVAFGEGDVYTDCLVTREWSPLEPGHVEKKWYCAAQDGFSGGLALVEELKEKTLRVEYVGASLPGNPGLPGEDEDFPASSALDCDLP